MKKMAIMVGVLVFLGFAPFAQEQPKKETSYERFISQSGKIMRFQDYKMVPVKGTFTAYNSRVRMIMADNMVTYYYQMTVAGKYTEVVGSIEDKDLDEMAKALVSLRSEYAQDAVSSVSDYLENKYITNDGVSLGYFVSGKDSSWYFVLDKYKSDATAYFKDVDQLAANIKSAQDKIAQLKKNAN